MKYNYQYWKKREISAEHIQRVGVRLSLMAVFLSFAGWLSVTVTASSQYPLLAAIILPPCVVGIGVAVVFGVGAILIMFIEWLFDVPYCNRIIQ